MKNLILLLILACGFTVFAAEQDDPLLAELCSSNKVEGHYPLNLGPMGQSDLYLVCLGTTRIVATVGSGEKNQRIYHTMVFSAIDGDILTLASFKLTFEDAGERPGIGEAYTRLQLRISALKEGVLLGRYRTARLKESIFFNAPRASAFPNLLAQADLVHDYGSKLVGLYTYTGPTPHLNIVGPLVIDIDVFGGEQRISVVDSKGTAVAMYLGMSSGAHNVFYAGAGVRDGLLPFVHLRGRLVSADQIEFYYFTTMTGMKGPFTATRSESFPVVPTAVDAQVSLRK